MKLKTLVWHTYTATAVAVSKILYMLEPVAMVDSVGQLLTRVLGAKACARTCGERVVTM